MIDAFLSVCVSGGRGRRYGYNNDWVNKLHRAADRNLPWEIGHYCLTDNPNGLDAEIIPINISDWYRRAMVAGWWAKVRLHDPALPIDAGARLMYSDIDNLLIKDLSPLVTDAAGHDFAAAPMTSQNFRQRDPNMERRVSSSFMIWTHGTTSPVFEDWDPAVTRDYYGDQDWMGTRLADPHVLPRESFCRGTRLIRRGWGNRPDLRVVFCTRHKNDKLIEAVPEAGKHWR